jgi:hypothetical protein
MSAFLFIYVHIHYEILRHAQKQRNFAKPRHAAS